ncbi:Thioredoxin domain-containing protein [Trichinella pseudospiralis]
MENKIAADATVQSEVQHAVIAALENEVDAELARLENLDDEVLRQLRQKRVQELKAKEEERENWRLCRHGEYTEITSEREFFDFDIGNKAYRIKVLQTKYGKAVYYIRGFDEFGGTDDFTTETVEAVLAERNLIFSTDETHGFTKRLAKAKVTAKSIRSGTNYGDSDSE